MPVKRELEVAALLTPFLKGDECGSSILFVNRKDFLSTAFEHKFRYISPSNKTCHQRPHCSLAHPETPCPSVSLSPVDLLSLPTQQLHLSVEPAGKFPQQVACGAVRALEGVPPVLRTPQRESLLILRKCVFLPLLSHYQGCAALGHSWCL